MDEKSRELLERAAAGDPDAIREIKEWAARSTDIVGLKRLLKVFQEADEEKGETDSHFWSDLLALKNATQSKPASTGERLDEMLDRARGLGNCETVQALGLRSFSLLLLGDLSAAEDILREAWELAPFCRLAHSPDLNPCVFYLCRRQSLLDLACGRHESALSRAESSLEGFRLLGSRPTHDLNGDGVGSSLHARASVRFEMKDYDGSIADFTACLDRFPVQSRIWARAYQNLAYALSKTGYEGRKEAHAMLEHQRLVVRSREKTVEGATFLWVDGQLCYALGIRRDRAMKRMKRSLAFFGEEGMPDQYCGVTLDIARAYYPRRDKILDFLNETKSTRERLIRGERQKRMLAEIYDLVDGCPGLTTLPRLDDVLRRFREALTLEASLPPCLLIAA